MSGLRSCSTRIFGDGSLPKIWYYGAVNTPWSIIFGYELGQSKNAQAVYNMIVRAALQYKHRGLPPGFAVRIDSGTLTDAIFGLNSHDTVELNGKQLSGQKVKELFITTILLKRLETKFVPGDGFFIVLPEEEGSCDTAVMVVKPDAKVSIPAPGQLKVDKSVTQFLFQIKEYTDFARLKGDEFITPQDVDPAAIAGVTKKEYEEFILVFIRDFLTYKSEEMQEFFAQHQNWIIISSPASLEHDGKPISLDPGKHNYAVSYPWDTLSIEIFDRPPSMLTDEELKRHR